MTKRHQSFRNLLALVTILLVAKASFSQKGSSNFNIQNSKNEISLSIVFREHFDGSPIIDLQARGKGSRIGPGIELMYSRKIGLKGRLSISLSDFYAVYRVDSQYPWKVGDVVQRNGLFAEIIYNRLLFSQNEWDFSGLLGLQYRDGYEFTLNYIYHNEINTTWYDLRDPGLTAGLSASRDLFWRLRFNSAIKFTQYFFRFDDGSIHGENYPNRSTRNLLRLQAGLGFQF